MSSFKPNQRANQVDTGEEVPRGFFVAGGDAPEVFDYLEEVFDQIAFSVERIVALPLDFPV